MNDERLLPCPFCNGTSIWPETDRTGGVITFRYAACNKCWARGPVGVSDGECIEHWNIRAQSPELAALREQVASLKDENARLKEKRDV